MQNHSIMWEQMLKANLHPGCVSCNLPFSHQRYLSIHLSQHILPHKPQHLLQTSC